MRVTCKKHPKYRGHLWPKAKAADKAFKEPCGACRVVYYLKHVSDSLDVIQIDNSVLRFWTSGVM